MQARWRCHDSLFQGEEESEKYDVVIGNPPWEKVKLTRHEFLKANGACRHYGSDYAGIDHGSFAQHRTDVSRYGALLATRYPLLGTGEPDLYKAFLELFLRLVRPGGAVSVLVPAGLIRSQGTVDLRRFLFETARDLSITVLENRARFFSIDTRFKFVALQLTKAKNDMRRGPLRVTHARGHDTEIVEIGSARIGRRALVRLRPDLTVPEVRSEREWRLFRKMSENALPPPTHESLWHNEISREIDMTRDRDDFATLPAPGSIPVVEGRMVHQHRFGAKAYRHGTGRRAIWDVVPLGQKELTPQFWFPRDRLSAAVRNRVTKRRAGFCDITGQTNERSMLAALIPANVVCGNKVPTVTFPNDTSEDRLLLWLAVVNSFSFDWALRRLVTTTVNYFVLRNVPFPVIAPHSLRARRIVDAARLLHQVDTATHAMDAWQVARLRASIDLDVHLSYSLDFHDLRTILQDFPLLDRGQPSLPGEYRSTVSRDFLLSIAARRFGVRAAEQRERVQAARAMGAVPYTPSEFLVMDSEIEAGIGDA